LRRLRGKWSRSLECGDELGWFLAEEDAEPIDAASRHALELGLPAARGCEEAVRPLDIERGAQSGVEPGLREVERVLLRSDRGFEDFELPLGSTELGVVARHITEQRDVYVTPAFLKALHLGNSRLHVSPHAAEDVDLPACVEPRLERVLYSRTERRTVSCSLERRDRITPSAAEVPAARVNLRQRGRRGDPAGSACFAYARGGNLEVQIDRRCGREYIRSWRNYSPQKRQTGQLMPKLTSIDLTRRESQIMEILYRRRRATVEEIRAELPDAPSPSSVRKLLEIMIERGLLAREYDGPRYVYFPAVKPEDASRSALKQLVRTFFDNSPGSAMAALLDITSTPLSAAEYRRLSSLLKRTREQGDER